MRWNDPQNPALRNRNMTDLVCRYCYALLAKTDDIMAMSTEGA